MSKPERGDRQQARLRVALLVLAVAAIAGAFAAADLRSIDRVNELAARAGGLEGLFFVVVSAAAIVALVPASLVAAAGGYLFGTTVGTIVSIVAVAAGSQTAFAIAGRVGGHPFQVLGGQRLHRVMGRIERRGFLAVLYARLLPGSPFTIVNYAAGLTRIPGRAFLAATVLGFAPRALAYASIGGHISNLSAPEAQLAIGLSVLMALLGVVVWLIDRRRSRAGCDAGGI